MAGNAISAVLILSISATNKVGHFLSYMSGSGNAWMYGFVLKGLLWVDAIPEVFIASLSLVRIALLSKLLQHKL